MDKIAWNITDTAGIAVSVLLIVGANVFHNFNMMVWAFVILGISLLFFCARDFYRKIGMALFCLCIFTFLTGGIMISYFKGDKEWMKGFSDHEFLTACNVLFVSYLSLLVGFVFSFNFFLSIGGKQPLSIVKKFFEDRCFQISRIQKIAFVLFVSSTGLLMICNLSKLQYSLTHGYMSLYKDYEQSRWLPVFLLISKASLFIGLASKPQKRRGYFYIIAGMINPLIELMQGVRGAIVSHFLFSVFYIYECKDMRLLSVSKRERKQKFLRMLIFLLIIGAITLPLLDRYGYTRANYKYDVPDNIMSGILAFFQGQSVSFPLIGYAVRYKGKLPGVCYSFGSLIDSVMGNHYPSHTIERALYSNDFGSCITYLVAKGGYLNGYGLGSSYIAEVYYDFGCLGVTAVNFLLGKLLRALTNWKKRTVLEQSVMFYFFYHMLGMPRASLMNPINKLLGTSTILTFLIVFGLGHKNYSKNQRNQERSPYQLSDRRKI